MSLSRRQFLRSAALTAAALAGNSFLTGCTGNLNPGQSPTAAEAPAAQPSNVSSSVLGVGRGIFPGRVTWAHNPQATSWDGENSFWWKNNFTDQKRVDEMLSLSLRQLTGQTGDSAAWEALFTHFKAQRGQTGGYQPGEKIAIKVNLNGCQSHQRPKNNNFSSPSTIFSLVNQLVKAGVRAADIVLFDSTRDMPDPIVDVCKTDALAGLRFADFSGGDGREACLRDLSLPIQWSLNTQGSPAYLPTLVTEAVYIINLSSLKGHSLAGVTLTAKNHFGTLMSDLDGQPSRNAPQGANLHGFVAAHDFDAGENWRWPQAPMASYNPLVDLIGHPHLGGKTLLFVLDALYGVEEQNAEVSKKSIFQSAPFNGHWPSSLLLSQDPVAIDSVGADILANEPIITSQSNVMPKNSTYQNYLHEAALAQQPPSKTDYKLASLGVHDHWNNADEKKYARNLGLSEGIELLQI